MTIDLLRKAIIQQFSSVWELNDKAHQKEHFEDVFQCGMILNTELELNYEPKLILFAAYFHDMFAWSRNNHHEMSFHWVHTTDHKLILDNLSPHETMMVAWACNQHRASFRGSFKSNFCELINSADRGVPGDVMHMLHRAVKYREKLHPEMSDDERMAGAIAHLKEKYGDNGYARYPDMYFKIFGKELDVIRKQIASL